MEDNSDIPVGFKIEPLSPSGFEEDSEMEEEISSSHNPSSNPGDIEKYLNVQIKEEDNNEEDSDTGDEALFNNLSGDDDEDEEKEISVVKKKKRVRKVKSSSSSEPKVKRKRIEILGEYTCEECNKIFRRKHHLTQHKRNVHDVNPETCLLCSKEFKNNFALQNHLKRFHSKANRDDPGDYDENVDDGDGDGSYVLVKPLRKLRDRPSNASKELQGSEDLEGGEGEVLECRFCEKTFTRNCHRNQHEKTVHEEDPAQCDTCQKTFKNQVLLKIHIKRNHTLNKDGEVVKPWLKTDQLRREREKSLPPVICDICGKCMPQISYRSHMKFVHEDSPTKCDICLKEFPTRGKCKLHIKRVHHDKMNPEPVECEICHKKFKSPWIRTNHMKNVHPTTIILHKCNNCGKEFTNAKALARHIKLVHEDVGIRYQCNICLLNFKYSYYLKIHQEKKHLNLEEKYKSIEQCEHCGKIFNTKQLLYNHKETHNPTKDFICMFCSSAFKTLKRMRAHQRTVHGKQGFNCQLCDEKFTSVIFLERHITWKHITPENGLLNLQNLTQSQPNLGEDQDNKGKVNLQPLSLQIPDFSSSAFLESFLTNINNKKVNVKDESQNQSTSAAAAVKDESQGLIPKNIVLQGQSANFIPQNSQDTEDDEDEDNNRDDSNPNNIFDDIMDQNEDGYDSDATMDPEGIFKVEPSSFNTKTSKTKNKTKASKKMYEESSNIKKEEKDEDSPTSKKHKKSKKSKKKKKKKDKSKEKEGKSSKKHSNIKKEVFPCSFCPSIFSNDYKLRAHIGGSHSSGDSPKTFKCTECPETFLTPWLAKKHKVAEHPMNNKHTCNICNIGFEKLDGLNYHNYTAHDAEKPFNCGICKKDFTNRCVYDSHMEAHDGGCVCDQCGKNFPSRFHLSNHRRRMHDVNFAHYCTFCNKGCIDTSDLRRHMEKHDPEKKATCEICGKGLRNANILKNHIKNVHGVTSGTTENENEEDKNKSSQSSVLTSL